jgi:hypothetical protein
MPLINAMLSSQVINQKARASAKAAPTFPLQVCRCALRKAIKPGISYFSFVGMKRIVSFVLCEDAAGDHHRLFCMYHSTYAYLTFAIFSTMLS